jgi:tetratricopeptide (TPR) repeat protein
VFFDQLLGLVDQRISDYRRSGEPAAVLSEEALVQAAELWQAAQPAIPGQPTPEDYRHMAAACDVIGRLHLARSHALPDRGAGYFSEVARAVIYFAPLTVEPLACSARLIPGPLQALVGGAADANRQANVAADLLGRAMVTDDPALLEAAVWLLLAARVTAAGSNQRERAEWLANLGVAYGMRFERAGDPADLDRSIELSTEGLAVTPEGHPERAGRLSNLGTHYRVRFERRGMLADLDQAIDVGRAAVAATPRNRPDRAMCLSNLGGAYQVRFRRAGELADLDRAIELGAEAVEATPECHPDRPMSQSNLASAYLARFERQGLLADIDQAIEIHEEAIAATPRRHPDRARRLSNLGFCYGVRFARAGVAADLDRAIEVNAEAVATEPTDHPERAGSLSNLSRGYRSRFDRGGVLADLDRAIELGTEAVAATPSDHPERAARLSNLSSDYRSRFDRGGVLADLDRAIELGTEAVAATPSDHPERAARLSNLGSAYRGRFGRARVLADIDRAIQLGTQAVADTPEGHPERSMYLSNLGDAYRARFEQAGLPADLDLAIRTIAEALAATPDDHPSRAGRLSKLGLAYRVRSGLAGVPGDLDRAIELGTEALAATPGDHPDRAIRLANLGVAYQTRLDASGQGVGPQTLRTLADQVAATTASPAHRVSAAQVVGSLAHAMNEHRMAVRLLDAAVSLLPSVAPREAGWPDQEHRLGAHWGLVGETVAAHCAINDPAGAVEAAELGRGVLLAAQLDSRSDLTDLDGVHPDLAAEFRRVRVQLSSTPAAGTAPGPAPNDLLSQVEHRKRLWSEHDQLLVHIRQQPGFAQFLRPPRLADLQSATTGGAAVLVNAGSRRSDAIIITAETGPVHVPLPDAAAADIASRAAALLEATHDNGPAADLRRQRVVPEILGWLWDTIVEPVVHALPPAADGTRAPQRVWWMPTGLLGLFPLHAAGRPEHPGALDAVLSSYTPTLRTLAHARSRPPATARRQLTVALHRTPGLPDLPGTIAEARTLHACHPGTRLLLDQGATASRVLAALPEATWVHFACHASADLTAPSQGGLVLHDATLALPQISQLQLGHAELAYLSACSTAERGIRLADESLHLASAFQLAGFRHVIASLWPLNDHIAVTAAAAVYRDMPATPTADHAPVALHHAARDLRARYPDRPDLWAALIHSGP